MAPPKRASSVIILLLIASACVSAASARPSWRDVFSVRRLLQENGSGDSLDQTVGTGTDTGTDTGGSPGPVFGAQQQQEEDEPSTPTCGSNEELVGDGQNSNYCRQDQEIYTCQDGETYEDCAATDATGYFCCSGAGAQPPQAQETTTTPEGTDGQEDPSDDQPDGTDEEPPATEQTPGAVTPPATETVPQSDAAAPAAEGVGPVPEGADDPETLNDDESNVELPEDLDQEFDPEASAALNGDLASAAEAEDEETATESLTNTIQEASVTTVSKAFSVTVLKFPSRATFFSRSFGKLCVNAATSGDITFVVKCVTSFSVSVVYLVYAGQAELARTCVASFTRIIVVEECGPAVVIIIQTFISITVRLLAPAQRVVVFGA